MVNPPVYSEFASIPSDNTTASVVDATTAVKGKVLLPVSAPPAIATTGTAGTPNATVATADHTHAGVGSVVKQGSTPRLGALTLQEGSGVTIEEPSPGTFKINASDVGRRVATVSLGNGISSATISFASAMSTAAYGVLIILRNEVDADPIFQPVMVKAKTVNGFDIILSAPTDSAFYFVDYIAYVYDTAASSIDPNRRSNSEAIAAGVKLKAITFSSTLGTTNYGVVANLINLTDVNPQVQPICIVAKTATGFTVAWSADTDSANYLLDYIATPYV
jgi:hypothetical protein